MSRMTKGTRVAATRDIGGCPGDPAIEAGTVGTVVKERATMGKTGFGVTVSFDGVSYDATVSPDDLRPWGGSTGGGNPSDWLGEEIEAVGFDGTLKVASATGRAPGSNPYVATGTDTVEATLDGRSVTRGLWCECGENGDGPATVYFEIRAVDDDGELAEREAHGHACVVCRRMVQVG